MCNAYDRMMKREYRMKAVMKMSSDNDDEKVLYFNMGSATPFKKMRESVAINWNMPATSIMIAVGALDARDDDTLAKMSIAWSASCMF